MKLLPTIRSVSSMAFAMTGGLMAAAGILLVMVGGVVAAGGLMTASANLLRDGLFSLGVGGALIVATLFSGKLVQMMDRQQKQVPRGFEVKLLSDQAETPPSRGTQPK